MKIPGTFTTYVIDETKNRTNINDIYWRGALLSSMMRYFKAKPVHGARVMIEKWNHNQFAYFFESARMVLNHVGFVLGDTNNTVKYGENLLFSSVSEYLLSNRRISVHRRFFENLSEVDPLMMTFVAEAFI